MILIQPNGPPLKSIANFQAHSEQSHELDSDPFYLNVAQFGNTTDTSSCGCELYCEAISKGQTNMQCHHCVFWHQVHYAWDMVLENQFHQAYSLLYQSQTKATQKQDFVIQFILAIVDSLTGCYENAENVLAQAPNFFNKYHDAPQAFSAQMHLAYLYLQTERSQYAHTHIEQVLQWLCDIKVADPQMSWWHPEVMAHTLAYAIAHSIQSHTARRIFMLQIGQDGKDALLPYLYGDKAVIQRNTYRFYSMFNDNILELVPKSNNPRVRQIIHQLLQKGDLLPEGFSSLKRTLTTATHQKRPNAALIATFGLYVNRYNAPQIAEKLDMSQPSIRNYITTIYEVFNLEQQSYNGQQARFHHLLEIVREKGHVP